MDHGLRRVSPVRRPGGGSRRSGAARRRDRVSAHTMTAMHRVVAAWVAILLGSTGSAPQSPAPPGSLMVTPGDLVVDPRPDQPRLRVADRRRCQPQCPRRGVLPQGGQRLVEERDAAAAPAARAGDAAERLQPRIAEHVRRQRPGPRARHRLRGALGDDRSRRRERSTHECDPDRDCAHASGTEAGRGRQGVSRLPGGPHRAPGPNRRSPA